MVYLFYGQQKYLRDAESARIIDETGLHMPELNLTRFDESASVSDVICACESLPLMDLKRVIVLSGIFNAEFFKPLAEYVLRLPDTTVLIISVNEIDKRQSIYKAISTHGRTQEFPLLKPKEAAQYVLKENAKFTSKAADKLVEMCGSDLQTLSLELEKFTYIYKERIDEPDVEKYAAASPEYNVFFAAYASNAWRCVGGKRAFISHHCGRQGSFFADRPDRGKV